MAPTEMTSYGILIPHQLPATPPCSPRLSTPKQGRVSSQAKSRTIVVRGFLPYAFPYSSNPLLTSPSSIPTGDMTAASSGNGQMLAVGGTSGDDSTSEQKNLIWNSLQHSAPQLKKREARLHFGDSSDEDKKSLPQTPSVLVDLTQQPLKKHTFLKEDQMNVKEEQAFGGDVFETEEGEIDESAVDDDDEPSDWEDLVDDSREARTDEKIFQRVDAKSRLISRQSLITLLLQGQLRNTNALGNAPAAIMSVSAVQNSDRSSPKRPSLAVSPKSKDNLSLTMKHGLSSVSKVPRSQSQPINPTQGLALSPRSIRQNMLASELTVSLRQQLLWVRKQTTQSDIAITKRGRAAYDVANLKQIPEKVCIDQSDGDMQNWNDYYGRDLGGYHSRGW
ncbi:uncharacterized protein RSE6_15196 [Rhynchosporium secalis]|uniref:DUF3295 domain-containing protein n=1 Tax=Rhynchosporium secalis TaxID=38038 RepID=A0A1E1MWU7_RHYSE|nr:uncharacterized protein RSE6_15196 [Rhynchosporium secalis]